MSRRAVVTRAADIKSERVRWFWAGRIPRRAMVVIAGEKGLGKSALTNAELVARLTKGELDGELKGTPRDVVVITAEDDWKSAVKPRLQAHGADLSRVHRFAIEDDDVPGLFTLPDDVGLLADEVKRLRDAGNPVALVVIDPIGAFVTAMTNTHADAPVRRALAPLSMMAEEFDLAVLVIAHLSKDDSKRLLSRVTGSGAFVNAPRSVLILTRDPDDPDGEQGYQRLLIHVASNWGQYAPTLAFHIAVKTVKTDDGASTEIGVISHDGESSVSVDDLQRRDGDISSNDCEEAITAELRGGAKPSLEVKSAVRKRLECSFRTVERAAVRMRDRGELTITDIGFPRTTRWALTTVPTRPKADERRDCTEDGTEPNVIPSDDSGDSDDTQPEGVAASNGQQALNTAREELDARFGRHRPPEDWQPYGGGSE